MKDEASHSLPDSQSPDTSIDSSSSTPSTSFSDSTSSLISISATDSLDDDSITGKNNSLPSTTSTEISTETDEEAMHTMPQEQQTAWEDATTDLQIELTRNLDPPLPLDHQMICDIQKIASRLAAKSSQLSSYFVYLVFCFCVFSC